MIGRANGDHRGVTMMSDPAGAKRQASSRRQFHPHRSITPFAEPF